MHLVITNGQGNVDPANNWRICCSKWSYCHICPCRWQLVHLDYRQFILLNSIIYISSISPYCSVCTIMTASKQQWKRWHTWDLITVLWYFTSTTVASAFISHITENARLRHIKKNTNVNLYWQHCMHFRCSYYYFHDKNRKQVNKENWERMNESRFNLSRLKTLEWV